MTRSREVLVCEAMSERFLTLATNHAIFNARERGVGGTVAGSDAVCALAESGAGVATEGRR